MRSLMITKFVPLPATTGGRQRSWAVLERLMADSDVVLCCLDDGTGDAERLRSLGVEVHTAPWRPSALQTARGALRAKSLANGRFFSPQLAASVRRAMQEHRPHVLQVESTHMTTYAHGVEAPRRLLDLENVESALAADYARTQPILKRLPYRIEAAALAHAERQAIASFDVVSVVSDRDRALLGDAGHEVLVCPNGWTDVAPPPVSKEPVVAFVATLGWAPNSDAAVWFTRNSWPLVKRQVPDAELLLVGRDPSPAVQALAAADVHVTGTVEDVRPYLSRTSVALAPLLAGGGSRLKILEALAAERPVVATTVGASGLEDLIGSGVLVADEPGPMAADVVALLRSPERAHHLGALGRSRVLDRYSWDRTLAPLVDAWRQASSETAA